MVFLPALWPGRSVLQSSHFVPEALQSIDGMLVNTASWDIGEARPSLPKLGDWLPGEDGQNAVWLCSAIRAIGPLG